MKQGKVLKPQKIDFPSEEKIIDISCGDSHTLVLLKNGLIYGWGYNFYDQLGLNEKRINNEPKPIEITQNQEKFKYIYCYADCSFAITTEGSLFSWGNNRAGLLGQLIREVNCIPRKVNLINVQKIGSDFKNIYFLTNEGKIYFCCETQSRTKNH